MFQKQKILKFIINLKSKYFLFKYNNIDKSKNKEIIVEKSKEKIIQELDVKHIILDCSCMNYIDSQGINAIIQV
jgi:hypothetical protein